jgi:hypothetical protein
MKSFIFPRRFSPISKIFAIALGCIVLAALNTSASEASAAAAAKQLFDTLKKNLDWNVRENYTTGLLRLKQSTVITTTLHEGNTYKLVAAGCKDARDIDIAVYDSEGDLVDGDNDESIVAVATVTPKTTGEYRIKVTMFNSTPDGAHYVLQYAWRRTDGDGGTASKPKKSGSGDGDSIGK